MKSLLPRSSWISPEYLAADIYGRLLGSLQGLGDSTPPRWQKKINDAKDTMVKDVPPMAYSFPAVLQGWQAHVDMPPADSPIGELFKKFADEPIIQTFLRFTPFTYAPDAHKSALKTIQSLRSEIAVTLRDDAQAALELAAFIVAHNHDAELVEAVAVVAIERLAATQGVDRVLPTAIVLVECAATFADRAQARATLARRLENMAFVAPGALQRQALDIFRALKSIDEELSPLLTGAIATARLGIPRIPAGSRAH
jgi:hypothetical protein